MLYTNQVLVFPIGMKVNANHNKTPCYKLELKNSLIKIDKGRRDTLKIGNATRLRKISEDTIIDNCVIYFEGTLTADSVVPFKGCACAVELVPGFLMEQFHKNEQK
ncbi:hypothetical protein P9Z39_20995 [Bacillus thuringiensis]|uniref:hypothetical protein n=1 Tax=Bacillus thuringiensis TaxID=1428 RepID=UPI000A37140C|nr:hypothetical protein [Bacillus thuringiensis]MEC2708133.1 hypothetical protein [Bacillus thuringiensis]OUB76494.1 hypothetical protein BK765_02335 [Bacillus thuringiensis serovar dakota]